VSNKSAGRTLRAFSDMPVISRNEIKKKKKKKKKNRQGKKLLRN
jgi:hypothetical protein